MKTSAWILGSITMNKAGGGDGPITPWQIDGGTMEIVTDFIFLGSKITADGNRSHEMKRHLLLGRKAITNLDSILKSRDITDAKTLLMPPNVKSLHNRKDPDAWKD